MQRPVTTCLEHETFHREINDSVSITAPKTIMAIEKHLPYHVDLTDTQTIRTYYLQYVPTIQLQSTKPLFNRIYHLEYHLIHQMTTISTLAITITQRLITTCLLDMQRSTENLDTAIKTIMHYRKASTATNHVDQTTTKAQKPALQSTSTSSSRGSRTQMTPTIKKEEESKMQPTYVRVT
jgi:hypothetical protein